MPAVAAGCGAGRVVARCPPDWVNATSAVAFRRSPMSRAANERTPPWVRGSVGQGGDGGGLVFDGGEDPRHRRGRLGRVAPTEVSPDSITASAPSRIALATSDASARVGRELSIIDSSVWVATITGRAFSRAICTMRFCTSGTCSRGDFDAEVAARDHDRVEGPHDRLDVVDGFGFFDLCDHRDPATRRQQRRRVDIGSEWRVDVGESHRGPSLCRSEPRPMSRPMRVRSSPVSSGSAAVFRSV